jgi:hypothetical protein
MIHVARKFPARCGTPYFEICAAKPLPGKACGPRVMKEMDAAIA